MSSVVAGVRHRSSPRTRARRASRWAGVMLLSGAPTMSSSTSVSARRCGAACEPPADRMSGSGQTVTSAAGIEATQATHTGTGASRTMTQARAATR